MDRRIIQWQKQIDKFKESELYKEYLSITTEAERVPEVKIGNGKWSYSNQIVDPSIVSKRGFDGIMKTWKREIHQILDQNAIFVPEQFDCNVCGEPADLNCSGCHVAIYCGEDCQRSAWKMHQFSCIK